MFIIPKLHLNTTFCSKENINKKLECELQEIKSKNLEAELKNELDKINLKLVETEDCAKIKVRYLFTNLKNFKKLLPSC